MHLYIVRHTEVATPKGICYGLTDVPLSPHFLSHAKRVNTHLQKLEIDFDAVFASPSQRVLSLAHYCGYDPIEDPRLLELNFGDWEGLLWDEIYKKESSQYWFDNWIDHPTPNGESFYQLEQRVREFLSEIRNRNLNSVLLFSHSGVIRAMYHILKDIPYDRIFDLEVDFGSVHSF